MPMTEAQIINELLMILQHYSPTGKEQQMCSEMLWAMQKDGLSEREIIGRLTDSIGDGLKYGNWPWTMGQDK
jgi:hypothetical protein